MLGAGSKPIELDVKFTYPVDRIWIRELLDRRAEFCIVKFLT
jgi:hypothetical protein